MGSKRSRGLTSRQREWLGHLQACRRSGETIRAYAKRHRLSDQAMYQAARDLRQRGALPQGRAPRSEKKPSAFVKIAQAERPRVPGTWRARLPNGVVLEGSGAPGRELVEALAQL